jgi:predicted nuclease of restriction endonuclease-like (RecB) superfamily
MANLTHDDTYLVFLSEIKAAIRSGRNKAVRQLSRAVIELYWDIGRRILESQQQHGWGKGIVEQLARDLQEAFPATDGFSARNLWDMRRFYETYSSFPNLRQRVAEIAWGHHLVILNKVKHHDARLYYLEMTQKMAWSRDVLLNQIKAGAWERHLMEPKLSNFGKTLPEHFAEQANDVLKSSYSLEFLGIHRQVLEAELESRLLQNLKKFLLELGYGFTFMGSQFQLKLEDKTYRVDLLFFHRVLRCLVAIDLKMGAFKPDYLGRMNFHLELLDEQVRMENENPSIGIILCGETDQLEVEYALRSSSKPIGVAEYQLYSELPENLVGLLPSPDEIRERLGNPGTGEFLEK